MKVNIGNYPENNEPRKVSVVINEWDSYSADNTLALIIYPLLVKLKKDKQGSPNVDDEDVPDELKSTNAPAKENEWDIDDNYFKRWNWVMDEMIFAMKEISECNPTMETFYDWSSVDQEVDFQSQLDNLKVDIEGLELYNKRVQNGCILFGKYFQGLWS